MIVICKKMRSYKYHLKLSNLNKRIVKVILMKLYTVLMMMKIEYTAIFVINYKLNDFKETI